MGHLQVCSPPRSNDVVFGEYRLCGASPPLPTLNPDPGSIGAEPWAAAERTTHEVVCRIHPTLATNYKMREVIEYVQGLITSRVGCEVHHTHAQIYVFCCSINSFMWVFHGLPSFCNSVYICSFLFFFLCYHVWWRKNC
jgi:hypothetical protein